MKNHLFISPGTLTRISAHAIAYSASSYLGPDGSLYSAFENDVPGFATWYARLRQDHGINRKVGHTFWIFREAVPREPDCYHIRAVDPRLPLRCCISQSG